MKIIGLTAQHSGVGYHRIMMPLTYMPKEYALFTDKLSEDIIEMNDYNILLINRMIPNVPVEEVKQVCNKYGLKLIVDIDDYWKLDPHHILYEGYEYKEIINYITNADIVTCSNELLYKEIKEYNNNVEIIPNALPYGEDQYTDIRIYNDKTTFIHTGGITHELDIQILRNPLARVFSDSELKQNTKFTLCGYNDVDPVTKYYWDKMVSAFTCSLKLNCSIKKVMEITNYMNFYNDADCLLVPMIDTKFNSMKSNLKVLEAGAKGIPVITSNVMPYKDCPYVLKVSKQPDWYKLIKQITKDKQSAQAIGKENQEWCFENYSLDKINKIRYQIYNSIL